MSTVQQNEKLCICIPTYNRADFLNLNLALLIPVIIEYGIPIYISDNGSTDKTSTIVEKYQEEYQYIYYRRNDTNKGFDANVKAVLEFSKGQYAWLLGDDDTIVDVKHIIDVIDKFHPYAIELGSDETISEGFVSSNSEILSKTAYDMGWLSSVVISREIIDSGNFSAYLGTWYVHVGVVMDFLINSTAPIYYIYNGGYVIKEIGDQERTSEYSPRLFYIIAKFFPETILRLPISYDEKISYIRENMKKNGLLSNKNLLGLRSIGLFSSSALAECYSYLKLVNETPYCILQLISIMPISLLRRIRRICRR